MLGYEVLLMRLFSIVQWHHFAAMIISVALLGFGASGTFLALARRPLTARYPLAFGACAALFAVTAVACVAAAIRLPFNVLELIWDPAQLLWLAAIYALLVPPFFFGGTCIGLAFARFPRRIGRVYAWDLVGAGAGAIGIILVLLALSPAQALRLLAGLGLIAAALAVLAAGRAGPRREARATTSALVALALVPAVALLLWLPPAWLTLHPHISPYKGLSMALRAPDARIIDERSSPLGLLSVVESPTIPFRHAPGLSLTNMIEPPAQLGVFTDADGLSAITRFDGDLDRLAYLDQTTSALPYHLIAAAGGRGDRPAVLILGAGGGEQVLLALLHGAGAVVAVEVNRQMADLVGDAYADFAGHLFARPEVTVEIAEARSFVAATPRRFDLVLVPPLGSYAAATGGGQSLHGSYAYTVEAVAEQLAALRPGGLVAITRWLKLPPRDSLKLFATAVAALERRGVDEPGRHLAMIRSWKTTTLLIRNQPLTAAQIRAVRAFTAERAFDAVYFPGMDRDEANRAVVLADPVFHDGAVALLDRDRQAFVDGYKFAIAPATDGRPYFFDFFRWRALPELVALRSQGGGVLLDWGYLILFATLAQAALASVVLIMLPLWLRRRFAASAANGWMRARIAGYFLALGLAFLFIEIAFIQRFMLFLGNPLYAVAVVLAAFLVFAGLGSAAAPALARAVTGWLGAGADGDHGRRALPMIAALIALIAVGYLLGLSPLFDRLMALAPAAKIAVSVAAIAPLAFFMGMPFPLGLAHVAGCERDLVPWAWGINGCASVISAILATILAMHWGFAAVVVIAAALYLAAAFLLPALCAEQTSGPAPVPAAVD